MVITKENFEAEVFGAKELIVLDFWATWCGPCKMIAPVVAEIAKEYEGKVKVGKVNVDEENALAMQYRVASIPTLLLFENGKVVKNTVGFMPKSEIIATLGL